MTNLEIGRKVLRYTQSMELYHSREKRFLWDWFEAWDWGPGVAHYGMIKWYERTKDQTVIMELKKYVDGNMSRDLVLCVNSAISALSALKLWGVTGEERYLKLVAEYGEYMSHAAPRAEDGAVVHTCVDMCFPEEIWVDTLFMAGLFLVKTGAALGRQEWIQDGVKQILLHLAHLADEKDQLLYHAYHYGKKNHLSACRWARGNCWASVTIAEVYPYLKEEKFGKARGEIEAFARKQAGTLAAFQKTDGMWSTVIDKDMKSEVSAAAGFAYGLLKGGREGYLESSCLEMAARARDGVVRNIAEDGRVMHVSAGTGVQADISGYGEIPDEYPMPWGQGLALMMLSC